jgi:hypothetical protein
MKKTTQLDKKATFWRTHLDQWQRSEQTQTDYCKTHELSRDQFAYWRKRFLHCSPTAPALVPVHIHTPDPVEPIKPVEHIDFINLHHGACRIALPLRLSPDYIAQLVRALS